MATRKGARSRRGARSARQAKDWGPEVFPYLDEVVYSVGLAKDALAANVEFVSDRARQITGCDPREFCDDPGLWMGLIHPNDLAGVHEATRRILETRSPGTREYRLRNRETGEYRVIEDRVVPRLDRSGRPTGMIGAARDVTDQRRLQAAQTVFSDIAAPLAGLTGESFLNDLVIRLSLALRLEYALVGELLEGQPERVKTLAFRAEGRMVEDSVFPLAGTPCENVLEKGLRCYASGIRQLFSRDPHVREFAIESYCGAPLFAVDGRPLGIIAVMGRGPMAEPAHVSAALGILAIRVAAELERVQADRAIRAGAERYRSLFEGIPMPAYAWRVTQDDLVLTEYNQAALRATGGRIADLLGTQASVFYAEDPEIIADFQRCARDRATVRREMLYRFRSTSQSANLDVSYAFVPPDIVMVLVDDVSEKQRAKDALIRSEQRYRSLVENAFDGIAVFDDDAGLLEVNARLCAMLGHSREELLGTNLRGPLDREGRRAFDVNVNALRAGRGTVSKRRLRRRSGSWIHVEASSVRVQPGMTLSIVRDLSERQRATKALRELSLRLLRAQDEERRRLARELHDHVGQALVALGMRLAALGRRGAKLGSQERAELEQAQAAVKSSAMAVRTMSYLLHPPLLDESGLPSALRWLVDGFGPRSGIQVRLEVPEAWTRPPAEIELALFRIAQEALANVHVHSGSTTASVRLRQEGGALVLEVEDQGRGFPLGRVGEDLVRGVGIASMRERAQELGGRLEVESKAGLTAVRAILPVTEDVR